ESAMLDFAEKHDFDRIVLIQATSPLTSSADLDAALVQMDREGADSLLTGTHEFRFRWAAGPDGVASATNYDPVARPRRQDWGGELVENGAFYVTSREALLRTRCRLSGKVAFYPMPPHTAVEIDNPEDWQVLEALVQRHSHHQAKGKGIKLLVTDV